MAVVPAALRHNLPFFVDLEARKLKMLSGGALFSREARHAMAGVWCYEARSRPASCGGIDRHVGARMRERRIMLGLTQQQLADGSGSPSSRRASTRRASIAFPRGACTELLRRSVSTSATSSRGWAGTSFMPTQQQRLHEFARNFMAIPNRRHQEELVSLARALAEPDVRPPGL